MEKYPQGPGTPSAGTEVPEEYVRVWPVLGQSFSVLLRNIVPFVVLAAVVGWSVGYVLFLTGLAPFLVLRDLRFSTLFHRKVASLTLHAASRCAVEGVIAMAVWSEMGGRRITLKASLITVARAIPRLLHRPFYLYVSRVSAVGVVRAFLFLPYHAAVVHFLTSGGGSTSGGTWYLAVNLVGFLLSVLVDSRLLALVPVAAIERDRVFASIRRCWRLTARHWSRLFWVILLAECFTGAFSISVTTVLKRTRGYLHEHDLAVLLPVAVVLVLSLIRCYRAVVEAVCYRHLRVASARNAPPGGH